ncbi:hypothetical protein [Glutamicibacter halophytocola]|uniref:hypothetical protein n=1 Tax=Glutamicibacter halophytocola TaxID=1933880 RepID=UPI0015C55D0C|nr:hypothetical protein [Glutamicibacter halophytocola]NQD40507.1 hypothetical protein [Glutamicibacter halophytocola]
MIYLGTLGRMIGIKCPASQNTSSEERFTFTRTLEGKRKAQTRPVSRRTWSLQTSQAATPTEHSLLTQFAEGAWGYGPFIFVSAEAPHTNLLSPNWSMCDPSIPSASSVVSAGPVEVEPGLVMARSYLNTDDGYVVLIPDKVPVLPGVKVTGSAYVLGSGMRAQIIFRDTEGALVQSYSSVASGASGAWQRLSVTQTPPAGAAYVQIAITGDGRSAGPVVTWTDTVQRWSAGNGCYEAVADSVSSDLTRAVVGTTYSSVSFTISEVG